MLTTSGLALGSSASARDGAAARAFGRAMGVVGAAVRHHGPTEVDLRQKSSAQVGTGEIGLG